MVPAQHVRFEGEGTDTDCHRSNDSDAFSKREAADENKYVREKEMEKLQALRAKINESKKGLDELEKQVYVELAAHIGGMLMKTFIAPIR